jgi:large subunit ribosomal protein L9
MAGSPLRRRKDYMKVLLCEDVKTGPDGKISPSGTNVLGWLGDVVEVSTGYARNYLLPQRLAIVPTEGNLRSLAKEAARRAEQRKLERERLEAVAAGMEGSEAVVAAKANEQGVLFGSVGAREVAENLRAQGFQVADEMVQLAEHIKQVGTHKVTLRFDKDLTTTINVVVVAEGQDITSPKESEEKQEDKPNGNKK